MGTVEMRSATPRCAEDDADEWLWDEPARVLDDFSSAWFFGRGAASRGARGGCGVNGVRVYEDGVHDNDSGGCAFADDFMLDDKLRGGLGAVEDEIVGVKSLGFGDFRGALAGAIVGKEHAHDLLGAVRDERQAREAAGEYASESIRDE